jgi:hypothetical protein
MQLCPNLFFLSIKQFSHELLPKLVEKTKQLYVFTNLTNCQFVKSFDLWMSKAIHDVFALMINIFLNVD